MSQAEKQKRYTLLEGPWRWVIAAITTIVIIGVTRVLLIEVLAAWNRWQFSMRPELENWTFPYYGTELPASLGAVVLGCAVLVACVAIAARNRKQLFAGDSTA